MGDFSLRCFRPGDEVQAAERFNRSTAGWFGPFRVTPESWLGQYGRRSWRGPGLDDDADCVRVAERDGHSLGHCAADYGHEDVVIVQELCVGEGPEAEAVAEALVQDAEARGRERGKSLVVLNLAMEEGLVAELAARLGYAVAPTGSVFMTLVTDLAGVLRELRPELTRRLRGSAYREWSGGVALSSGELRAGLVVRAGEIEVTEVADPDPAFDIAAEALPQMLFGRTDVGELFLQGHLHVQAADRWEALRLLAVLFPRLPICLPRAQGW